MSNTNDQNDGQKPSPIWVKALYAIIVILVLLVAVVFGVLEISGGRNVSAPIFILILIGLALLHWILIRRLSDAFKKLRRSLHADVATRLNSLKAGAEALLASKVDALDSKEALLDSIAELFNEVALKAEQAKVRKDKDYQPEIVKLFGASSIQPRADEMNNQGEAEQTPFDRLVLARERAEKQNVLFYRYVRLFDEKNFLGRSLEIRVAYISWLEDQIALLTRSPLYTLFNARRAPRWKAIRSSITSESMFVDILGDGESGFVVHGGEFAKAQRRNADDYIRSAKSGGQAILSKFSQRDVANLETHLEEMRKLNMQAGSNSG